MRYFIIALISTSNYYFNENYTTFLYAFIFMFILLLIINVLVKLLSLLMISILIYLYHDQLIGIYRILLSN